MDRSRLNARRAETHRAWINAGCIKAVHAEDRHVDIASAFGIDSVSIAFRPDVDGHVDNTRYQCCEHDILALNVSDVTVVVDLNGSQEI